ncbi:methylated-DNA--[protein]-cysteine S-methyltransferase [Roseibium sediminis]|uniref:methylated-DNA--[protein]-cysteine S-methyltransferase n=1 Tax=Roseibium sediminis TaxID=1775174 RepID=UPI001AD8C82F|nr:methylated-DNA--[protein]-cysteine S-methyltransferase [Roseibium sediminis]
MIYGTSLATPVGHINVQAENGSIVRLSWTGGGFQEENKLTREAARQLQAYFSAGLKVFDLPLNPKGAKFHQSVFKAMLDIPYGNTRTYGEIAKDLATFGQPVGQACGANPIPIIIPCHRVLSANGLGGYSGDGGLDTKIALLKLEGGYPFLL